MRGFILVLLSVLMAGCSFVVLHNDAARDLDPGAFQHAGHVPVDRNWWTAFHDRDLNILIEQALQRNYQLLTAFDRLKQAQAIARKSGAQIWPWLNFSGSGTRMVTKSDTGGMPDPGAFNSGDAQVSSRNYKTTLSLSAAASYEVDLWGRVRALRDAATRDTKAAAMDLCAMKISISAEVAGAYYQLVQSDAALKLLNQQVALNQKMLDLLEFRFNHGRSTLVDVLQQKRQLAATRSEIPVVRMQMDIVSQQLAVLQGSLPEESYSTPRDDLPELPPLPDTGIPAELIRRRPDIQAAWLRVESADYRLGAAIADRFPSLRLTAGAGTDAADVGDLFDNWLANIAGNLLAPVFEGGLRAAEVDRNRAVVSERIHSFRQAVLQAFTEVENALSREAYQTEYINSLKDQIGISRQVVAQTRMRYLKGLSDYLPVLESMSRLQALERSILSARLQQITYRISLYRALAGDWNDTAGVEEKEHEPIQPS